MSSTLILIIILAYFLLLLGVAFYTSRNSNNDSFFIGNRSSNWMLVAFGMIGTSLSGVTFISVPGTVGKMTAGAYPYGAFEYYMMVVGFFIGYFVVAGILLPLYYRMNLTSIYTYLGKRFNTEAHKIGSIFFIISRGIGATARLYLVVNVLQIFLLEQMGVPFWVTAAVLLLMVLLYTFEGGVKTIVITDTLQTSFMILSLIACIGFILSKMDLSMGQAFSQLADRDYTRVLNLDPNSKTFFLKTILGGMFITIAMTGLDQEMMQKNISVNNVKNAKKNMITFSFTLLVVNLAFLFLGGLLYLYAQKEGGFYTDAGFVLADGGPNVMGDDLFPALSLQGHFPGVITIIFVIGLISALFPSADGALTAVTSSFCVDILNFNGKSPVTDNKVQEEKRKKKIRMGVHLTFTVLFFILIMIFKAINNKGIVYLIMEVAGYTYGPLLGLFAFGIFTKKVIKQRYRILAVTLLAPLLTYAINYFVSAYTVYQFGVELIILNGLITFLGLYAVSQEGNPEVVAA
ncbi:MAG: sodium:solute symporter [Sphingobacteriales bacterium]|nr:MAG: sodium:solute symporter [Sphingobacteriales bacterium]